MGKRGLNDIEFTDIRTGYEHEQGLTARMMDHPDCEDRPAGEPDRRDAGVPRRRAPTN